MWKHDKSKLCYIFLLTDLFEFIFKKSKGIKIDNTPFHDLYILKHMWDKKKFNYAKNIKKSRAQERYQKFNDCNKELEFFFVD